MTYSIAEIAAALGTECAGDTDIRVSGAAEPGDARADQLAMAMSPDYAEKLEQGGAQAAMLWPGADWEGFGLKAAIFAPRPRRAMAGITALMDPGQHFDTGIHSSAVIDPSATIAEGVSIGPFSVIGPRAEIGQGSQIGPQCFIGADVRLGKNAYLREMVSIGARAVIGDDFFAHPGVRVGSDGFSFVTPEVSGVENVRKTLGDQGDAEAQSWMRIHSLGAVTIGDNVEIGANSTLDNGTIRNTEIGSGTKMDCMVHVGHNVRVGRDCLLCGQSGIAGSAVLGDNVVLGGQSGVTDNIIVGDRVIAAGATKLLSNVPEGRVMMGYPAVQMDRFTETYKALRRLTRLSRDVSNLKKAVFKPDPSD